MNTYRISTPSTSAASDRPSAVAYWGTGLAGIGIALVFCVLAGLRF